MAKKYKLWNMVLIGAVICIVLQSCSSSRNKYGCPERIYSVTELLP